MIARGILLLARGSRAGIKEFGNTLDNFTASIAPLIAFPLVFSAMAAVAGQLQLGLLSFLSHLCAVLVLPVITHEFARRVGMEGYWLRAATALNWSFWMLIPALFVAAFIAAVMVEAGLGMVDGEYAAMAMIGLYFLWYHWFIVRAGLGLGVLGAMGFVALSSLCIGLFSAGPMLIDWVFYGVVPHY
jgi:hypothetical protein